MPAPRTNEPNSPASSQGKTRVLVAGCLAHLTHDGLTDMLYVFFPVWQQLFSLSFLEVGLLKTFFSGTMASFQLPAGRLGTRLGLLPTLVTGTMITSLALFATGYCSTFLAIGILLFLGGLGSSAQHPLASSAIANAYAGQDRRTALSAYNFIGDVGKLLMPSLAALLIARLDWQSSIRFLSLCGIASGLIVAVTLARANASLPMNAPAGKTRSGWFTFPITPAFASLSAIGVLDSATRVGLLTFLPFLLRDKGADLPTLGLALGLIFAGGAAGKLACGILASRLGILRSVILTETATACAILCMVFLPLSGELLLCPVLGVVLNGTSSILYGSVPELVDPPRNEAFAFFYTVGIGSGAVAPFFYGLLGDALGVVTTLVIVAVMVLATTPLTFPLRGKLR
ncbi:MAG: MFS transporter [Desulfovibrio sp.]|nr:MFS transporter [Desulfovibrio sp.]MBI4959202.1 MFS transporter [Desulfovibrio sp.]